MRSWQRCRFTFPWSGAPVVAAQVYSQWGEHNGASQSFGLVFFSLGISIFSGGGSVFIVLARFKITG